MKKLMVILFLLFVFVCVSYADESQELQQQKMRLQIQSIEIKGQLKQIEIDWLEYTLKYVDSKRAIEAKINDYDKKVQVIDQQIKALETAK